MTTLEDKLLGEKREYYCSSSESDGEESNNENEGDHIAAESGMGLGAAPSVHTDPGGSTNTGPKGVIKDWQKYRQLETEKREEQERERLALIQKLSMTCRSVLDDEKQDEEDAELSELLSDAFLMEYSKHRMQEMLQRANEQPTFGLFQRLESRQAFLDAIDKEHKAVTVVIHIFEDRVESCKVMNECLEELSKMQVQVKFCALKAGIAGMSREFTMNGVPALLVYKGGNMVGNYIQLGEEFGREFTSNDVENFLIENGMLADRSCIPSIIKQSTVANDSDDD